MNPMETILSSSPGVEAPGKVRSEEETPVMGFLAMLGLEVDGSSSDSKQQSGEIEEGAVPEVANKNVEVKKQMSGPEENWGGVPLSHVGKRNVDPKERISGEVSETAELDLPKGVPVVEKESLPEATTKLENQDQAGGCNQLVMPEKDGEPVKVAEQVLPEEMTKVHRRTGVQKKTETSGIPENTEVAPAGAQSAEDGLFAVPETENTVVQEMVHRVPSMGLQAMVADEDQLGFVKTGEPKIGISVASKSAVAESASPLIDAVPPAMLLKEVPLQVEEVMTRMVPAANLAIKREDSVSKRVLIPTAPVAIEAVPSKGVTVPSVPPPMNLPSASQVSETTMRMEQLSNQFDQRLLSMVEHNEKVMRITMEPASMGKMTVLCREENASMTIEIHVQNQAVRELIARQEDDIRRVMQECNVDVGGFDVLMSEQREDQRQSASDRPNSAWKFHGISPASKEVEGVGETPVYLRRHAASWVA